jgi:hypothetical protein
MWTRVALVSRLTSETKNFFYSFSTWVFGRIAISHHLFTQKSCASYWNQHSSYSPSLYEGYQSAIKLKIWISCKVDSRYTPYIITTQDRCVCYRKQCVTWTFQCTHFIISSWSGKCQLQLPYVSSLSPTFYRWLPIFSSRSANTVPQISFKKKRLAALTFH